MTLQDEINQVIQDKIQSIQNLIALGWTKNDAITNVRNASCLGEKTWSMVIEQVNQ